MDKDLTPVQKIADSAAQLVHATAKAEDERTIKIIKDYFDEGEERKRFIDVNRIPFICDDIKAMRVKIDSNSQILYTGMGIIATLSILVPILVQLLLK